MVSYRKTLITFALNSKIVLLLLGFCPRQTTSQLMFYRRALHSQRKGDLSMKEFLMKIKTYCANLANCGEIISEHEHVTTILNGIPPEYEPSISIIVASQTPYSVQNVISMLIDAEACQQVVVSEVPCSANLVSRESVESTLNDFAPTYRPSASRGRGRGHSRARIQCQLCGKTGHLVDQCYYRFNASYKSTGYRPPP
ncbi:hypothetical protein PVK06_021303 [Gossypium arboreum]|uniref:CCHC-type domain-containing protein n=1 Tax=Gossypium arboreum TaxID=29729 RepID=A0ABR0PPM1_GOSAR|nr:hypothetical protein PVK06_021303 [Gossypium arboreum]